MSCLESELRYSNSRGRQIQKTFNNIKIIILCGFVTILVLCGTIGVNLSSSDADAVNQSLIEETNRILAEIRSDFDPDDNDIPHPFQSQRHLRLLLRPQDLQLGSTTLTMALAKL
ncbi:hypothetical protein AHAS_Ahas18G0115800 [Arachis hypogaea]